MCSCVSAWWLPPRMSNNLPVTPSQHLGPSKTWAWQDTYLPEFHTPQGPCFAKITQHNPTKPTALSSIARSLRSQEPQLHALVSHLSTHPPETLQMQPGFIGDGQDSSSADMYLKTLVGRSVSCPSVSICFFPCLATKHYTRKLDRSDTKFPVWEEEIQGRGGFK